MDKYSYRYEHGGEDPYCYPGSAVLINKLNIRDAKRLQEAERNITGLKLLELQRQPISGRFGMAHLCAIHRFIFQEIYRWAGTPRVGGFLAKGGTLFVQGAYIKSTADKLFTALAAENKLRGLSRDIFISRLAYYMGEVNALHPFREGNGRVAREFFRTLALNAGYRIDYGLAEPGALLHADVEAYAKNYAPLIHLLDDMTE